MIIYSSLEAQYEISNVKIEEIPSLQAQSDEDQVVVPAVIAQPAAQQAQEIVSRKSRQSSISRRITSRSKLITSSSRRLTRTKTKYLRRKVLLAPDTISKRSLPFLVGSTIPPGPAPARAQRCAHDGDEAALHDRAPRPSRGRDALLAQQHTSNARPILHNKMRREHSMKIQ